jgi:hypothetical protein
LLWSEIADDYNAGAAGISTAAAAAGINCARLPATKVILKTITAAAGSPYARYSCRLCAAAASTRVKSTCAIYGGLQSLAAIAGGRKSSTASTIAA